MRFTHVKPEDDPLAAGRPVATGAVGHDGRRPAVRPKPC